MRRLLGRSLGVIAALLVIGRASLGEDVLPAAFFVPKNATKVVAKRPAWDPRKLNVDYALREAYPAEAFIAEVRRRLEAAGFRPVADDGIDARYEVTRTFRWRSHVLRDSGQTGEFFNWRGEWSNHDGDVVNYFLQYKSGVPEPGHEGAGPDNQNLIVSAGLAPKWVLAVSALPAALIVLDGAKDAKAWRDQTLWRGLKYEMRVRYAVTAAFPPKEIMTRLSTQLKQQDWVWKDDKSPGDIANPNNPPGWNESKRTYGTEQQFVWQSRWVNPTGDQVSYSLTQFALPASGQKASAPDSDLLEIEGSLLSRREIVRP
jgi:hypothetical protein